MSEMETPPAVMRDSPGAPFPVRKVRPCWSAIPAGIRGLIEADIQNPGTAATVMASLGIRIKLTDTLETFKATLSPEPVTERAPMTPPAVARPSSAEEFFLESAAEGGETVPVEVEAEIRVYGTKDVWKRGLATRQILVPTRIVREGPGTVEEWLRDNEDIVQDAFDGLDTSDVDADDYGETDGSAIWSLDFDIRGTSIDALPVLPTQPQGAAPNE